MDFVWSWALIASVIAAAVFLVVTLAHMEAGTKVKGKWLAFTLCSFTVVAGLVFFRPKSNMEKVQYLPAPSSFQEQTTDLRDTAQQKSDAKATESGSGKAGGEQSQGTVGENQGNQVVQVAESIEDKEQVTEPVGGVDPVLEEIMMLKRQAEERKREVKATIEESTSEESSVPNIDLLSDGQTGKQADEEKESQQPGQIQQMPRGKVLPASLNVRDKEGLDGRIIGTLKSNEIVEVAGESKTGEWLKIKLDSGQTGWVMKKYINVLP